MPTYGYKCGDTECGHVFEELQRITAEALVVCPECQKKTLKRLIGGGGGIIFKGTGFYCTDYKNNNPPKGIDEKSI